MTRHTDVTALHCSRAVLPRGGDTSSRMQLSVPYGAVAPNSLQVETQERETKRLPRDPNSDYSRYFFICVVAIGNTIVCLDVMTSPKVCLWLCKHVRRVVPVYVSMLCL